ncbi:MAG TPA: tetratricopeptide repeat protein, partial [Verrucomicrobiae bacterium]|nr:tetratricopeptide repeat protein [Verrucomicrobiae bacterium]
MAIWRRWVLTLFVLVLGIEPLLAATREQTAYAAAKADFRSEFWSRAELEFTQFRQKYPESTNVPEAVLLQAQAAFEQNKFAITIALLSDSNHLAKAGALADQYVYWTGEAQFQDGELTNAAETFVSLARKYPGSPLKLPAVVSAAAAYTRLGQWRQHDALLEDTNGVFQQAARFDPGKDLVLDGRLSLENSKYQQRDFAGAVAIYDILTNHWHLLDQVQQCQATYLLYQSRMELGDFPAALAAATNLVQIAGSPSNQLWLATGWASKGEALERMGRLPDAIQAWSNNLTNAPLHQQREAVLKIAEQEMVRGQLPNAEAALTNFLGQFSKAGFADIALLTVGELHLKDYAAEPAATNQLSMARDCFDQFFNTFTNSPLLGKAYLDRGWCEWLGGNITSSLDDFTEAAKRLAPSADLALARFKIGDALIALTNYSGALENYQAVLNDFTNFPAVAETLGDRALYQSLRACLGMRDLPRASAILKEILKQFPASRLAPESALLFGEGLASATNESAAREVFRQFLAQYPDSPLRPQVEFATARTYEWEQDWSAAISGYQAWLEQFPTNRLRPQTLYALARVNSEAGNETNAFSLFTRFVTQYPDSSLAPQAQWWTADYYFNLGGASATNYVNAERSFKTLYQNTNWQDSILIYPARLWAGRAAAAR